MEQNFKKNILKGTVITSFGQIITIVFLFISSMILARYMPEKDLGEFFLLLAVWMLLGTIGSLGLEPTLIKYLSSALPEKRNEIFNNLLTIRILTLILISIVFFVITQVFTMVNPIINSYTFFLIIIFFLDSVRNFFNSELQASKRFKEYVIVQVTQSLTKIILYLMGIIVFSLSIIYLLYAEIICIIISFAVQQYRSSIKFKLTQNIDRQKVKEIFKFSFPLYMNNLLGVLGNRINSFIIAGFTDVTNVAYYEVSKKIPDGFSRLSGSLVLVYYPYVTALFSENKVNEAKLLLEKYIVSISLIFAPMILVVFLFKNEIMIIIFSVKYLKSSSAFFIFVISFYIHLISSILGYTLVGAGKPVLSFNINLARTIASISFGLILVPLIGFIGAVYSILIGNVISWFFGFWIIRKINIFLAPLKYLYPFFLCVPFMLASSYLNIFNNNFVLLFGLFFVFLIVEFFIFKDFRNIIRFSIAKLSNLYKKVI